jgi:uncharacterized protein
VVGTGRCGSAMLSARLASGTRVLITDATGPGLRVLDGVNHLLHLPGVSDNAQVLAPSAVTALRDWAQPYAQS